MRSQKVRAIHTDTQAYTHRHKHAHARAHTRTHTQTHVPTRPPAKVADPELVAVQRKEDVLGLDVAVADARRVEVVEAPHELVRAQLQVHAEKSGG